MTDLKPGPQLDLLIAEKVFNLIRCPGEGHLDHGPGTCYDDPLEHGFGLRHYSTDISEAFMVVDRLGLLDVAQLSKRDEKWVIGHWEEPDSVEGDTVAHVICLAALDQIESRDNPKLQDNIVHLPCGTKPDLCRKCKEPVCPKCYPDHDEKCMLVGS